MQFICFIEFNRETEHTNMTFLQYTRNEEKIKYLKNLIEYADYSENIFGEYSQFELSNTLYDEKTVAKISMLESEFIEVSVCTGYFDFPEEDFETLDECETALKLDDLFHSNQIEKYFE